MATFLETISAFRVQEPDPVPFRVGQILAWADAYKAATGKWPTYRSGRIDRGRSRLSWLEIDRVLIKGIPGTPPTTLARLLHEHRGVKPRVTAVERECAGSEARSSTAGVGPRGMQTLSVERILAWADAHRAATGRWPTTASGPIAGVRGDNWRTVAVALRLGQRGLPGNTTLAGLLCQHRAVRPRNQPPDLTEHQILRWADAHHRAHGRWPSERSGQVAGVPGETWKGVSQRLRLGGRGLSGGSSLARLLSRRRPPRNPKSPSALSLAQILAWADLHRAVTGKWPNCGSGSVRDAPGEMWKTIDQALRDGWRGLPGGSSLARLLDERRPRRSRVLTSEKIPAGREATPRRRHLTLEQVIAWAEAHRAATGRWPSCKSGPIPDAPGDTWSRINDALRRGRRGLPGGMPLSRLFPGRKTREIKKWSGGKKR